MQNLETADRPHPIVSLAGTPVDLMERAEAVDTIVSTARNGTPDGVPLAVVSANLDHLHHFDCHGRWGPVLRGPCAVRWLTLLDGHPLVVRARRLDGRTWPRLAGSDLIEELLDRAEELDIPVGFLGGTHEAQARLRSELGRRWPTLVVAGLWSPERSTVVDPDQSAQLARSMAGSGPQMLFVGLGKPRQELWISDHGPATGARVLLAFGASADFVAGTAKRAPGVIPQVGLEWLWRLALEPRRLARRYLVQGPPAYLDLWLHSDAHEPGGRPGPAHARVSVREPARVTALTVAYNSEKHIGALLQDLRALRRTQQVRVLVVDNGSRDGTRDIVERQGVELIDTHANLGYAGGINVGLQARGECDAVLVLNPDLRIQTGALDALWTTLRDKEAGAVVPCIHDVSGHVYESIRYEPSLLGGLGDALLGSHLKGRPPRLSDIDRDVQSYQFPHPIDWATGAAVLISESAVRAVGPWNEDFFLYCEETDYFHRLRETGATVWFDPAARVTHDAHGSGSMPELDALMAVNRVRYAELHHGPVSGVAVRAIAATCELLRVTKGEQHRRALHYLLHRSAWGELPHAGSHPSSARTAL